ncbi:hypothetical protein N7449_010941 [Penicillium cf. viridicatum]|uniref:Amidohydrolase 3 domain-containing protein n=1 Tax=Penicillium cf. viridicatum TaxID=2972119 RepID=A0A9W9J1K3_9EURO|nr:hypothetical protein N7449_010941 [Penicillium cf. viridicatum]
MDADRKDSVDVVYTDGEIITDANGPPTQAVFIKAGRIAAVGSNKDILATAGLGVSCSSLNGATVIPGLIDTHPHLLHFAAFKGSLLDIVDAKNHGEIVKAIRRKAEDLREGNLADRHILDLASADHQIMIHALTPKDPNVCAFNTAALKILGIGRSIPGRVNDPGAFPTDAKKTIAEINSILEKALSLRELQDDWLRIEGITACTYGPCYTGCTLVKDGYLSPSGETTTGKRGISEHNLRAAFEFCAKRGLRLNLCSVSEDEHDDHFAMAVEVMEKYDEESVCQSSEFYLPSSLEKAQTTRPGGS